MIWLPSLVGIVPGFGSGRQGYEPLVAELKAAGCEVLFFPSVRRGGQSTSRAYPSALERQAQAVVQAVRATEVESVTLLGHSMGAPVAAIVAALAPELVGRLVLVCPASTHIDTFWPLVGRLASKGWNDNRSAKIAGGELAALYKTVRAEANKYILSNPVRAFCEGWALARFSALEPILTMGLDAYFVYGQNDQLFKPTRLEEILHSYMAPARCILVEDIGHDPQNKPHEAARLVEVLAKHKLLP